MTADDVIETATAAASALRDAAPNDWSVAAGDLTWNCWETVEHTADDLFFYAAQLGAGGTPGHLPIEARSRRPSGPENSISVDPDIGVEGLLDVFTAMAALLAAIVRVSPRTARAHHVYGLADPEASAAMGVLETVVHTFDVTTGLGVRWRADDALCTRVIARLLPEIEPADDGWSTLLWACGRIDLPRRPRREKWSWDNSIRVPSYATSARETLQSSPKPPARSETSLGTVDPAM
ncbi:hypothetical protein BJD99_04285 [Rhodococcus sp. 1163]|nr:hypothetical protein BJD99_04285 [Rhodococcus sp. 1163]